MRSELSWRACGSLLVAGLLLGACDEEPPPVPVPDASRDSGSDAAVPPDAALDSGPDAGDAAAMDAAVPGDSGPADAGTDAGDSMDSSVIALDGSGPVDAAPLDSTLMVEPDAGCTLAGGGFDYCSCPLEVGCTTDAVCSTNQRCLSDPGCGARVCDAQGHPCDDDPDCPTGSTCERGGAFKMCIPSAAGSCNDARDCPLGYSCDSGACVDRRVACDPDAEGTCPFGYHCNVDPAGAPYCSRLSRRCATDTACPAGATCRDVDGDGSSECVGPGVCSSNSDCSGDDVCGTTPEFSAICSVYGHCTDDGDCAGTHECLALAGDGVRHCVRRGGSCTTAADCSTGEVCAVPAIDSTPRCVGSM